MQFTIPVEFDDEGEPLPGTRAMLYKLLGIKSLSGTHSRCEWTISPAPPDPDPKKAQSFLGVPPRLQKPGQKLEQKLDRRKIPHVFEESSVPCAGGCGRNVKYRGAGIRPKCPTCGGKGTVVEDKPLRVPTPKQVPEVPEILKTPDRPIINPELPKKVCLDCKTPLIIKFSKWFCPTCKTVKDAPKS
jgi:Zn finger protein HypA/HybF involved in hydrogenase expression